MVHCVTREEEGQLSSSHTNHPPALPHLLLITFLQVKPWVSAPGLLVILTQPAL